MTKRVVLAEQAASELVAAADSPWDLIRAKVFRCANPSQYSCVTGFC